MNWAGKANLVNSGQLALVAIEAETEIQGLMAIRSQPGAAVLSPGQQVLYVDYLETAPWNLRFPGWPLRFIGTGVALLIEAIIISIEMGFDGRTGLHSLPQAEAFYQDKCRMSRIGPDPNYYDLVYFEHSAISARTWLSLRNST